MDLIVIAGAVAFVAVWAFLMFKGKWFLTWPQWARLASMLAVAGGMFALIWYMQKKETEAEATMMGICWDSQGRAHYPEKWEVNAKCESPQPLDWKKSPKLVYWDFPDDFDDFRSSHDEALKFWNNELGHDHFKETLVEDIADVHILWGSANDGTGAMSTSHRKVGERIIATITVKRPSDIRRWMLEEQHELGHVLGLAHDRSGIMNPELQEGEEMKVWLLHKKDRKAVLESLAPKQPSAASTPSESE